MGIKIVDKLASEGIDINVGNIVIFDEKGNFIVQADTMEEAFAVADAKNVQIPVIIDLNGVRDENGIFYQITKSKKMSARNITNFSSI
jgi:ribosomal protein S2